MPITALHSFGHAVPDLAVAEQYYAQFGLATTVRDNSLVVSCTGRDQDQILVTEAARKRLGWVAFTVAPGSLAEMTRALESGGNRQIDGPQVGGDGNWFADPDGMPVRLSEAPVAEWRDYEPRTWNMNGTSARVDDPRWLEVRDAPPPQPRRLGHVIKYCPDLDQAESFYVGALGLRLSDSLTGRVSFWNCGTGDHHIFGVSASPGPGLHHSSFEVADFDEIATGACHMADCGHREQWGLGRHTFGSNLFVYVKDPWGSWTEYFSDIDQVTSDWQGRKWEPAEAGSAVWSPPMPGDFHLNTEHLVQT